jgi:hypothetical protein
LLEGVREEPALQGAPGLGRAAAGLQLLDRRLDARREAFVLREGGVEGREEIEDGRLALEEVGEEVRVVRREGAELVEEDLLGREFVGGGSPGWRRGWPGLKRIRRWGGEVYTGGGLVQAEGGARRRGKKAGGRGGSR